MIDETPGPRAGAVLLNATGNWQEEGGTGD